MGAHNRKEFKGSSEPSDVDFKAAILCSTLALGNPSNIRIMTIKFVRAKLKDGILMGVHNRNEFKGSFEPPDVDFKAAIL